MTRRLLAIVGLLLLLPVVASAQVAQTFLQTAVSTADASTYTFTDQNIGTASDDRCIVVAFHGRRLGVGVSVTSATIQGIAARSVGVETSGATNTTITEMFIAEVPTGTTATVVVNLDQTLIRSGIGMWALTGADCSAEYDADVAEANDPSVAVFSLVEDGAVIAGCSHNPNGTVTWGLSERYDTTTEALFTLSGASDETASTTNTTVTCNPINNGDNNMVVASWGPSSSVYTQTFLQYAEDAADLTTYTFAAQNIGTADAGRCIIAAIHARKSGATAYTIDTVTIGGVSASLPVQQVGVTSNSNIVGLAIAAVPTGTTADVVVTFNGTQLMASIGLWSTTGLTCTESPNDTDVSTATNPTTNLNVPANGFAIGACSIANAGAATATWTGLTERYDDTVGTNALHAMGASLDFTDAQSGLTITCDSTSTAQPAGVFASWGPAEAPGPDPGGDPTGIIGGGVF